MSTPDDATPPPIRIGNIEREAAYKALNAHLEAGRLDPDEYGERYAKASVARTRDELDVLFVDLPQPHAVPDFAVSAPPVRPPMNPAYQRPLTVLAPKLIALTPFIALAIVLFFHTPAGFLLIPASAILLGGGRRAHWNHQHGNRRWR
jgi:hypothetical protein